jgi:transcription elongation factor GreB
VFFGATVTYVDPHDAEKTVRIVGIDEARLERGEISWISPVARALMKASEGDVVPLRTPDGVVDIEVLEIRYDADA